MKQSKLFVLFLMVMVLIQIATCHPRLTKLKAAAIQTVETIHSLGLPNDKFEKQVDFSTELQMLYSQIVTLRNKAGLLVQRGGAECIKLKGTMKMVISAATDLQRRIESEEVCPSTPPTPVEEGEVLKYIHQSPIFAGSRATPLSFLSKRLSKFKKATKIFTTIGSSYKSIKDAFHQACDNIPNTLVIIKSGQYIAGGFTAIEWGTSQYTQSKRSSSADAFYMFSMNRQRIYSYIPNQIGILYEAGRGPLFGYEIETRDCDHNVSKICGRSNMSGENYDASQVSKDPNEAPIELFGQMYFDIDSYEVYYLE